MAKKIFTWIAVILWMAVIFMFSAQPASQSGDLSKGIIYKLIEFIGGFSNIPVFSLDNSESFAEIIGVLDHVVRKLAHFTIFAILGALVYNLVHLYTYIGWKAVVITASVCLLYAVSDEVHQLFVPGRAGMIKDVFIDFSGSSAAILISHSFCIHRLKKGRKQ